MPSGDDIEVFGQNQLQEYVTETSGPPLEAQQVKRVSIAAPSAQRLAMASAADVLLVKNYCGDGICQADENCSSCPQDCKQANGRPCKRIGMMYSLWHMPAWQAQQGIRQKTGKTPPTVDKVLRSRLETPTGAVSGALNMSNILSIFGPTTVRRSLSFHVHQTPQGGFYCIWKPRQPGALNYNPMYEGSYSAEFQNVPACTGYVETLTRHAQQLIAAGVDYVVADMTNIYQYSATGDAIQTRPFEVLLEVWSALRAQGTRTPDVAAWQRLPPPPATLGSTTRSNLMYPMILDIYNAPQFQEILMKDSITRKKLFFLPNSELQNAAFVPDIESNGGLKDIATVYMWVNLEGTSTTPSQGWNFMSFCNNIGGRVNISDSPLCQPRTSRNIGTSISSGTYGSQLAVSPSYQVGYASVTGQSTGQWEGITFQQQLWAMLSMQPDYVFFSTWNEFIAQPYAVASPPFVSQGFESDQTAGKLGYVDMLGTSFSRDIEPTIEGGSQLYDIMVDCLKLFRLGVTNCKDIRAKSTLCCTGSFGAKFQHITRPEFTNAGQFTVRSLLSGPAAGRTLLYSCQAPPPPPSTKPRPPPPKQAPPLPPSTKPRPPPPKQSPPPPPSMTPRPPSPRKAPPSPPQAKPSPPPPKRTPPPPTPAKPSPPPPQPPATPSPTQPTVQPSVFLSTDSNCEVGKAGALSFTATPVGYISVVKGGDFLRALRRCVAADGTRKYGLNSVLCGPGFSVEVILGYVR